MAGRIEENRLRKEMYQAHKFIAKNLRLLRCINGLNQEQVSRLLHMSRTCYSNLESGNKVPDFLTIYTLSRFYDVNLDYMLSFDITEHMLSLLRIDRTETEPLHFMEQYLKLSHGAKEQVCARVKALMDQESIFNNFPWNYGDEEK